MAAEQDAWVAQACKNVKASAYYMRKAIVSALGPRRTRPPPAAARLTPPPPPPLSQDAGDEPEALRHAAALLGELRAGALGPRAYYELYVLATAELAALRAFFEARLAAGRAPAALYAAVQHAGNVLPRLYLLVAAGAAGARAGGAPAAPLLADAAAMCKGVQHPTRGLFLRAYLVQEWRPLLPDAPPGGGGGSAGGTGEGGEGSGSEEGARAEEDGVAASVEFLLGNFAEMNKLWVRMRSGNGGGGGGNGNGAAAAAAAAAGPPGAAAPGGGGLPAALADERRERERAQLADLVGKNLTALAALEGLTLELYARGVLPRVLDQIVSCRDPLAQGYLMQVVAAAFPDEFHVGTLEALLGALPALAPGVRLAAVLGVLLDRLAAHAADAPAARAALEAADAFGRAAAAVARCVAEQPEMPAADLAAAHTGLIAFAAAAYPERLEYVDGALEACRAALAPRGAAALPDARAERAVAALLAAPLERLGACGVLRLRAYGRVAGLLPPPRRREAARRLAEAALAAEPAPGGAPGEAGALLALLAPLLDDAAGGAAEREEAEEDAALVARLLRRLDAPDAAARLATLRGALPALARGGEHRARVALTALALTALAGAAAAAADGGAAAAAPWFALAADAAAALADAAPAASEAALHLHLAGARAAAAAGAAEPHAVDSFERALLLFEDALPEAAQQARALAGAAAALAAARGLAPEARAALAGRLVASCARLLKRADQCEALLACAHAFWQEDGAAECEPVEALGVDGAAEAAAAPPAGLPLPARDAAGVVDCLARALRAAEAARRQAAVAARRPEGAAAPARLLLAALEKHLYFFDRGVAGVDAAEVRAVAAAAAAEARGEAGAADAALQAHRRAVAARVARRAAAGGPWAELRLEL
jgi:vacuolar protein sorting-associated protein 35